MNISNRLDRVLDRLDSQGGGDHCSCSPFGHESPKELYVKLMGPKVMWRPGDPLEEPPKDPALSYKPIPQVCSNEAQGKRCNPVPKELYLPPDDSVIELIKEKLCSEEEILKVCRKQATELRKLLKNPAPVSVIDLDPEPEPEPRSEKVDRLRQMVFEKYTRPILTREELAEKLLVPEEIQPLEEKPDNKIAKMLERESFKPVSAADEKGKTETSIHAGLGARILIKKHGIADPSLIERTGKKNQIDILDVDLFLEAAATATP